MAGFTIAAASTKGHGGGREGREVEWAMPVGFYQLKLLINPPEKREGEDETRRGEGKGREWRNEELGADFILAEGKEKR